MGVLVHVHVIQEATNLAMGIMIVEILGQVNLLFFDRADKPLGVAVLPGLAHIGHANLDINILEHLSVGSGCILDSLVRVMDFWGQMLA